MYTLCVVAIKSYLDVVTEINLYVNSEIHSGIVLAAVINTGPALVLCEKQCCRANRDHSAICCSARGTLNVTDNGLTANIKLGRGSSNNLANHQTNTELAR